MKVTVQDGDIVRCNNGVVDFIGVVIMNKVYIFSGYNISSLDVSSLRGEFSTYRIKPMNDRTININNIMKVTGSLINSNIKRKFFGVLWGSRQQQEFVRKVMVAGFTTSKNIAGGFKRLNLESKDFMSECNKSFVKETKHKVNPKLMSLI